MKDSLVNVLEDFEKLAYKILMWVILVPKTVIKVILDPGFVPAYVHGELASEKGKQFDEYISPMLLYLGMTLLPAIAIYFMPAFGLDMLTQQDNPDFYYDAIILKDGVYVSAFDQAESFLIPVTGGVENNSNADMPTLIEWYTTEFRANVTTKGDTQGNDHVFSWTIWGCGNKSEDGSCSYDEFSYGEVHDQNKGLTVFVSGENSNPVEFFSDPNQISIQEKDRNHVEDSFLPNFIPGEYLVTVQVVSYDPDSPETYVEFYEAGEVFAATESMPAAIYYLGDFSNITGGLLDVFNDQTGLPGFDFLNTQRSQNSDGVESTTLAKRLESSETIFLGLLLLLPPLLLAAAIGIFTGPDRSFGEESLKEHFYAQCYYFVPVGMAFWASYYSWNYHTFDIPFPADFLWMPLLLALLWFVVVEIYAIADSLDSKSKFRAFSLLMGCILVMTMFMFLGNEFSRNYNLIRESAILAYPIAGLLLVLGVIYNQTRKLRKRRKKSERA